jgi:hypothetical protein
MTMAGKYLDGWVVALVSLVAAAVLVWRGLTRRMCPKCGSTKMFDAEGEEAVVTYERVALRETESTGQRAQLESELRTQITQSVRAEVEARLRSEIAAEAEETRATLERELRSTIEKDMRSRDEKQQRTQLEKELRPQLELKLRSEIERQVRPEIERHLRAEIEQQLHAEIEKQQARTLDEELRKKIEEDLRPEMERRLRSTVEAELLPSLERALRHQYQNELRPQIEKEVRSQIEEKLRSEIESQLRTEMANRQAQVVDHALPTKPEAPAEVRGKPASESVAKPSDDGGKAHVQQEAPGKGPKAPSPQLTPPLAFVQHPVTHAKLETTPAVVPVGAPKGAKPPEVLSPSSAIESRFLRPSPGKQTPTPRPLSVPAAKAALATKPQAAAKSTTPAPVSPTAATETGSPAKLPAAAKDVTPAVTPIPAAKKTTPPTSPTTAAAPVPAPAPVPAVEHSTQPAQAKPTGGAGEDTRTPGPSSADAVLGVHERAQRRARVIVSDLALYDKATLLKAAHAADSRKELGGLWNDAVRSYNQAVPAAVSSSTNYLGEELDKYLAKLRQA